MKILQKNLDWEFSFSKTNNKSTKLEKQSVVLTKQSVVYTSSKISNWIKRDRDREIVHSCLYWFTPNKSYVQSSQKPRGYPLSYHHLITYTTTKRMTLNTSRKTLSLANTKIADLEHLKNTQPISATHTNRMFSSLHRLHLLQMNIWNQYK